MSDTGVHNLLTKADYDKATHEEGILVLDCFATWCGPCKVIAPKVVQFAKDYPGARFYKIDVDEVPDVAQELGVTAMPTFYVIKGGKEPEQLQKIVGANPHALEAAIKSNVK